ncbi:hypothetical protein D3C81_1219260 [compost metagenome]
MSVRNREQARSHRGLVFAWEFVVHLVQQRILVQPQLIDPALKLQAVFAILVIVLADELRRNVQLLKMHHRVLHVST